ncbi:hypothetical protein NC661_05590 [Aquibacillus koreensis]|uniref:Uncharacterized protein n=1 Tax=Aquibacillus koreensis TaxID=279446 RepID=A0A9X3WHI8_9BACI|nr:hypothetical protein [Aquibacillus koreensis]MCT2534656.1 hypothetical protein [Aquibacillus koreensis]MDC3419840.1 hypothetical protein [Aquibacillus koreensis]
MTALLSITTVYYVFRYVLVLELKVLSIMDDKVDMKRLELYFAIFESLFAWKINGSV